MREQLGELVPFTLHDLRRTTRTRLSELRIPADIAEAAIGHAKRGLERVYNQHEFKDEIRTALQAWADRLRSIVGEPAPTPPADVSNVVALRGVR